MEQICQRLETTSRATSQSTENDALEELPFWASEEQKAKKLAQYFESVVYGYIDSLNARDFKLPDESDPAESTHSLWSTLHPTFRTEVSSLRYGPGNLLRGRLREEGGGYTRQELLGYYARLARKYPNSKLCAKNATTEMAHGGGFANVLVEITAFLAEGGIVTRSMDMFG